MKFVNVIGAGLAGSEAALVLANHGIKVKLYECKRVCGEHEVYKLPHFAELVCSNSLGSNDTTNASGLLKEELRCFDSPLMKGADLYKVPAGQALAVDREKFGAYISETIVNHPNIEVIEKEFDEINTDEYTILASGPLTTEKLSQNIQTILGEEYLYFYDAVAPILTFDSIDTEKVYFASRYDKGEGEYINCPMNKEEYERFFEALQTAERFEMKSHEKVKLFEACMPVEKIAERGFKTLLFGPLKPKGLTNPKTGKEDFSVLQLRKENVAGELYNMVGFQTNLKWGEQKRVFSLIPGLENSEFVRYGVMHRNTFVNAPKILNNDLSVKKCEKLYMAGQITGSEGYVFAIATGHLAAKNIILKLQGRKPLQFDATTEIGAILEYMTTENKNFQPMGPNFGILAPLETHIRDKKERYRKLAERSLCYIEKRKADFSLTNTH
ncbi:MAG: methylenetetrahydrofolate--tRNA-(uracil(54)-C(5))-methyltransferase (FADH(2)-oxidizing) TrmFO [Fusobacteria bacterium]|nr:methylenetetrahydrofolate--tRNA-(uracil(54)-C(5))-methyltransferase (FADH(2)-oxidizing) TrmFO [Fusobacteriota bacterium]